MIYIIYDYQMNVKVIYDKKPFPRNKVLLHVKKKKDLVCT